jgi:molybdate/tungstate transport system permease protein
LRQTIFVDLQNDGVEAVYSLLWAMLVFTLPLPLLSLFLLTRRISA